MNQSNHGKARLNDFWKHVFSKELDRIEGEHMEFDWKVFPGFTTLGLLDEIQKMMTELKCELEHFKGRIIVMSMCNDIELGKR